MMRRIVRYFVESVQAQPGTVSTKYLSTQCMEARGGIERTKKKRFCYQVLRGNNRSAGGLGPPLVTKRNIRTGEQLLSISEAP